MEFLGGVRRKEKKLWVIFFKERNTGTDLFNAKEKAKMESVIRDASSAKF
jgi:hypothetical protein